MSIFGLLALLGPLLSAPVVPAPQRSHKDELEPPAPGHLMRFGPESYRGYTLFAPLKSKTTYLINYLGRVEHRWESDLTPGNSVYLLDNGNLLRCARVPENPVFRGGGSGGRLREYAPDGTLVWSYDASDETLLQHHDVAVLPNGNVLMIAWERIPRDEAIAAGRDPAHVTDEGLWPDFLAEIRPTRPEGGEVVWEWRAFDHVVQDLDEKATGFGDVIAHPGRIDINAEHRSAPPMTREERRKQEELERQMRALGYLGGDDDEADTKPAGAERRRRGGDWLHSNSIDYLPQHDLILLSVRATSEIWVIDHSTTTAEAASNRGGRFGRGGEILYRWGNPRTYGMGTAADQKLFRQHDARWLVGKDPNELRVLVFNNGEGRPGEEYSTVLELALPFDPKTGFARAEGAAFGPDEPEWSYGEKESERFYCSFVSGSQRLPNGNTLICSGTDGRIFEVTPTGSTVWDYRVKKPAQPPEDVQPPDRGGHGPPGGRRDPPALFRADRYPESHPGVEALLKKRR